MAYYDLRKVTVLVVEDSGFMAKLLKTLLHGLAVGRVEACTDAQQVLNYIRDIQPDLVFLDKEMPGVDGLQVAQLIRSHEDSPNPFVPIIMVTGLTKKGDVMAAREAGVTEFLAKPVSAKLVYERLVTCIEAPRPFVKTKTYYGPDRRRHVDASYDGPERRRPRKAESASGNSQLAAGASKK